MTRVKTCPFFLGDPQNEIRAGRLTLEAAADLVCLRPACQEAGKTWRDHYGAVDHRSRALEGVKEPKQAKEGRR